MVRAQAKRRVPSVPSARLSCVDISHRRFINSINVVDLPSKPAQKSARDICSALRHTGMPSRVSRLDLPIHFELCCNICNLSTLQIARTVQLCKPFSHTQISAVLYSKCIVTVVTLIFLFICFQLLYTVPALPQILASQKKKKSFEKFQLFFCVYSCTIFILHK